MNLAEQLFEEASARRRLIVVIGDVVNDVWVHGHTSPSQDGCAKFAQESTCETLGGAGNAMLSISNWPVHAELCGHWPNRRGTKTRFVEDGRILFRHDHDVFAREEHDQARRAALEWAGQAHGVLLSDYDKGFLTVELISQVTELCWRRGVPCVADVKRDRGTYTGCITKANEDWYLKHGIASVVTRGADCPAVHGSPNCVKLPPVPCVNHVGAGDCFAAHLALGLACGLSIKGAAAVAHSAGRVYVQHQHTCRPTPQDVAADLDSAL
jgi:bifunctional ADP-heptose synthase (sugar kinase/adenylyltransferase)